MDVMKVSANSKPASVAGAMANVIRTEGKVELQAVGAGAINVAFGAPRLSSALGFGYHGHDVAPGRIFHDPCNRSVKSNANSSLDAHLLAHELHILWLVDDIAPLVVRTPLADCAILVKTGLDLPVQIALVHAD